MVFSCSSSKKEEPKVEINSREVLPGLSIAASADMNKKSFNFLQLLSGKVEIELPKELQVMDKKMFELKYPIENPENTNAYSNEDGTVSLLISPRHDNATRAELPNYQKMLDESFGRNPSVDFRKSERRTINGKDFIVIEMITPAMDTEVYNLMFVTSLEGKLLIGTFNCTVEKLKEWQPIAEQILSSVRVKG